MDSILLDIRQARSTLESISLKMIIGSNLLIQDAGWAYESIRRLKQKKKNNENEGQTINLKWTHNSEAVTGETTITSGSLRKVHFFQAIKFVSIGRFLIVWIYLRKVSLLFKSALDCITLLIS